MELVSCRLSGAYNIEVAPRFQEKFCTLGQVIHMKGLKQLHRILVGKDEREWLLGRPTLKWTNIQVNVKTLRYENLYWIRLAQDKVQYRRLVNLKSEVHPGTGQEDPQAEHRYSSTLFLTSKLDGIGWSTPHPDALPPGNRSDTHFTGRRVLKISPHRQSIPRP